MRRLAAHRKVPNRALELTERMWALVRARLGSGVICARCNARYSDMDEKCQAGLDEACPGGNAVERVRAQAAKDVGLA
jgi:hypothetical protein